MGSMGRVAEVGRVVEGCRRKWQRKGTVKKKTARTPRECGGNEASTLPDRPSRGRMQVRGSSPRALDPRREGVHAIRCSEERKRGVETERDDVSLIKSRHSLKPALQRHVLQKRGRASSAIIAPASRKATLEAIRVMTIGTTSFSESFL